VFFGVALAATACLCIMHRCACFSQPTKRKPSVHYSNLRGEPSECSWDGGSQKSWDGRAPTCCAVQVDDNASCASLNEQQLQEWGDFELDDGDGWGDFDDEPVVRSSKQSRD